MKCRESITRLNPEFNLIQVKLVSSNPSFVMLPTALSEIGKQFKWKAKFILGLGYLYALCYNGNKAVTTISELKEILSTNSTSRIYQLLDVIETFNRMIFAKAG